MTIFGIGGFEVLLIGAIALFVLGPKRLLDGIRQGRRVYTDLKRQRDALQSLVTEAIDLEEIKKQVSVDEIKDSAASLENELALDQLNEDAQKSLSSSVSRKRKLTWSETSTEEERLFAIKVTFSIFTSLESCDNEDKTVPTPELFRPVTYIPAPITMIFINALLGKLLQIPSPSVYLYRLSPHFSLYKVTFYHQSSIFY